jgi:hypothetical protein
VLLTLVALAFADPSALYGEHGEDWDPIGRLPDFSYAGYHAGEADLPTIMRVTLVTDHGAIGDGITDNTAAFQAAIDATESGAIGIPAGTWRLDGELRINKSNIVLQGDGAETVLSFTNPLEVIRGEAVQWSWNGGLIQVEPSGPTSTLTAVTNTAQRGDRTLQVADASALSRGDLVVLSLIDDDAGTFGRHIHNDQFDGGTCTYQVPMTLDWPVFIAAVDGTTVTLAQPLRLDARAEWQPTLKTHPALTDVGVEHLTIAFPDVPYAGHLEEPGYNGVFFTRGVVDSWVRDVTFINADNGVLVDRLSKRHTIRDIAFEGRKGHHGLNIAFASDGMYNGLMYEADFVHHITVDHRANGNVFKNVVGVAEVHLDHHRDGPFENLFSQFDAEVSFFHGGNFCAGHPAGARETMWGLPGPLQPPYWAAAQANVVGDLTLDDSQTDDAEWVENVPALTPVDLHQDQLDRRLGVPIPDVETDTESDSAINSPPDTGADCACQNTGAPVNPLWLCLAVFGYRRRQPPQS